jgi:hypothetical protein
MGSLPTAAVEAAVEAAAAIIEEDEKSILVVTKITHDNHIVMNQVYLWDIICVTIVY